MSKFDTVELNVTFYRLLKKEAFERWYKETPADSCFCVKGSRFITHVKKMKDVELPLATFFNATAPLLEKLEVVLWQLPPNLKLNMKNLEDFVETLKQYPVRHVFEFRHKSWLVKKVFNFLSAANIAVCMADWPDFIDDLPVTADFVYIRRHGEGGNYATNYSTEYLKKDAQRIKEYMKMGKDVYYYFNNDSFGYAPANCRELSTILDKVIPKSLRAPLTLPAKMSIKTAPKKKTAAKKATSKKSAPAKTPAKKAAAKKAASKKPAPAKTPAKKAAVKKAASKKPAPAKTPAKKAAVKKAASKKPAPAKTPAKKAAVKKAPSAKKTAAKKKSARKTSKK